MSKTLSSASIRTVVPCRPRSASYRAPRREFRRRRGPGDRPPAAGEQVAGGRAEVGEGEVEQFGRRRAAFQSAVEVDADVLRQRVVVRGATAELAPLPQVDGLGDRPEAGVRRDGEQGDPVAAAGVRELGGHLAVGLLPGEQGHRAGLAQARGWRIFTSLSGRRASPRTFL
ncbi:hypothetical protein [Streptomyces tanashiensis]|uniref:Uncharacterized protein n=1 Tax=Streptomyces tanashiensis TaxID=67367 RepID=A0ABY6QQT7_9ACTN|nr:hypothetical protein [Streptomyces tanashiensis]UZX19531.1 hypothetical protein LDH80_01730 [Streptomyces tanashiensis]